MDVGRDDVGAAMVGSPTSFTLVPAWGSTAAVWFEGGSLERHLVEEA